MSSTIPPILIQLQADVSQLKAGLAQAQSGIKSLDDNVKKTAGGFDSFVGNLKKVGAAMGATFAASQVVNFAKDSIMAASSMAESLSKVQVVFGEGAAEVEKFGKSAADNLGISNQAALEATGTYGNLFQAFGLGQGESQKMSTSLVQLAADMASFNNTSVDDAILALRSGLSGETEPLKKFGVALSDARLKTEALSMGLISSTKDALTPAAKAQASYALIMKDTTLAQGDYARTADGTANTMKTLQAKFQDAKVAVGDALMPAFRGLLAILNNLIPVLKAIGTFFKNNQDEIKAFAITVTVLTAAWAAYTVIVKRAAIQQAILNGIMAINPFVAVAIVIGLVVAAMVKLYKSNDTFRKAVISVAKIALTAFASIVPMVGRVYEVIMKVTTGPLRTLLLVLSKLPGVGKFAKSGLDLMNKGLNGISGFADAASAKAKSLAANLDKMGATADKAAAKVKGATGGGSGGGGGGGGGGGTSAAADKAKEEADKAKEVLEKTQAAEMDFYEASISAHKDYQSKVASLQSDYAAAIASAEATATSERAAANRKYNESVVDANKAYKKAMLDIEKDYNNKVTDLQETLSKKTAELRAKASEKAIQLQKDAVEKEASIIKQSVDRLRNAFASGTGFSLSDMFKDEKGGGIGASLKRQLDGARKLQEAAGYLAGQGYAQTFIEEVVKAGPEVGLKMVEELKASSPEQQAEIRNNYMELEAIQETGLDVLARSMNNGANLATSELRDAYDQVAIDLKNSLAEVNSELNQSLADAQNEYADGMAAAKALRDEKMLEASTQLKDALAEAKATLDADMAEIAATLAAAREAAQKALDEGLKEAQATLAKALLDAQTAFDKAIDDISASTKKKLEALKAQLAEVAAQTAALQSAQAAQAAAAASAAATASTPIAPSITGYNPLTGSYTYAGGGSGTTTNINTSVSTLTNASPAAIAKAVTSEIKYGTTATVNTTTLAGILAASGKTSNKTSTGFSGGSGGKGFLVD